MTSGLHPVFSPDVLWSHVPRAEDESVTRDRVTSEAQLSFGQEYILSAVVGGNAALLPKALALYAKPGECD